MCSQPADTCPLCAGPKHAGTTTFTAELGFGVVVVRRVPATVCSQCGADWIADEDAATLERIVDEASGVSDEVYQAAGGSMSSDGAIMILAGNPTRASGYFYNIFKTNNPDWKQITVPCHNSTRVGEEYPRQMKAMYGVDTNVYRIRVLGLPPLFDDDKLIPLDLIEGAVGRDIVDIGGVECVWL